MVLRCAAVIAGALAVAAVGAWAGVAADVTADAVQLGNGQISTRFNLKTGDWTAAYADGTVFADSLACVLEAGAGGSTARGPRTASQSAISDAFGKGIRVKIAHAAAQPFVLILTMYDRGEFFLVQVRIPNAKGTKVRQVTLPEGRMYVGKGLEEVCLVANYWSGEWYTDIQPLDIHETRTGWQSYSKFYSVAYNRADRKSVILGSLYSKTASRIETAWDAARNSRAMQFKSRCFYETNPLTVEEETWESQPFIVAAPRNVFHGMEAYGAVAKAYRPTPVYPTPPSGWCSWDAGASGSEKDFKANVDAMKANRLDEYGLKYVQLDDGWQIGSRCSGNWRPNRNFPSGMKALADYVRSKGFEPGLWIGPFIEETRPSERRHPEFMVNARDNGYDLSSPKFQEYFRNEMKMYVEDWGFHYIKADFLSYGGDKTTSKTVPSDESYRQAIRIMTDALKPYDGYLMTCINHEWLSAGYAQGQRLGNDVHGGELTGIYPTLRAWPRRYFTNNNLWVGNPDMMHVNLPTDEQSRVWASFVALAGGAVMSGDAIGRLSPERIDIMKKAYPAQGLTSRPCDLFDRPAGFAPKYPRIWDCRVHSREVGDWHVVGLYNWTVDCKRDREDYRGENQNVSVDFAEHLELDPAKRYLVYDFWRQEYLGAFEKGLSVGMPPASCRVLVVWEEAAHPQVLGTDRHIVSGAEDLKRVTWDPVSRTLSGVTQTVKRIGYVLAVHTPAGYQVASATANGAAARVTKVSDYCAKIAFDTGESGRVAWSISFGNADTRAEPAANSVVSRLAVPRPDASAAEIPLRWLLPTWNDVRHDQESGPLVNGGSLDIGSASGPFVVCWDISEYSNTDRRLVSECRIVSNDDHQGSFEVIGDGKRLCLSKVMKKGESAQIDVPVGGVRELRLICHYEGGWFGNVPGHFIKPRLVRD